MWLFLVIQYCLAQRRNSILDGGHDDVDRSLKIDRQALFVIYANLACVADVAQKGCCRFEIDVRQLRTIVSAEFDAQSPF